MWHQGWHISDVSPSWGGRGRIYQRSAWGVGSRSLCTRDPSSCSCCCCALSRSSSLLSRDRSLCCCCSSCSREQTTLNKNINYEEVAYCIQLCAFVKIEWKISCLQKRESCWSHTTFKSTSCLCLYGGFSPAPVIFCCWFFFAIYSYYNPLHTPIQSMDWCKSQVCSLVFWITVPQTQGGGQA